MKTKPKLVRVTTVNRSLNRLLEGQLSYMSQYFETIGVSSPDDTSDLLRERENATVIDLPMKRNISPFTDLRSIWKMYILLRKEKPDIIHSHTPKAGLVSMIAGKFARVPIRMHTIAGLPMETSTGFKRKLLFAVERLIYKFSTMTYPNSYGIRDFVLRHNLAPESKIKVLGHGSSNGIDLEYFKKSPELRDLADSIRRQHDIDNSHKVFVFIGRLVVDKGITPLIDAWKILASRNPNARLILVGPYESDLSPLPEKTISDINSINSIITVGYQKDVRPYFYASDYFVFPSYREGLPNVLLQGGAMELPIIATDINGNTDIIEDNVNGIIIPPKDSTALLEAMERFLSDDKLIAKLKENARKLILEKYDRSWLHSKILEEYLRLLNKDSEKNI